MATPTRSPALVLALLAALLLLASAASDVPFIAAHKKAGLTRLKSGADRVSVSIDIYNQGSVTAYDVSLTDDTWAEDRFELISGNTSKSWERLDAGAIVSHSFVLESKLRGRFQGSPAVIKFRIPTKAALQESYSTPILPLDILSEGSPEKKFELVKRLLARYGSPLSVLLSVGLFVYVVAKPSKSNAAKGSKKRR